MGTTRNGRPAIHKAVETPLSELAPHPRNYRGHPEVQERHLRASIREHGLYRNVIAARDGTILAGHGVVAAAKAEGLDSLPVVRLDVGPDDPDALRLLVADNELGRLAARDDLALGDLLRTVAAEDYSGLIGTGYDEASLAELLRIIDARGEQLPAAEAWTGMPGYEQEDRQSAFHTTVHFATEEDAERFFALVGGTRRTSFWWPESDGLVGSDARSAWVAAS